MMIEDIIYNVDDIAVLNGEVVLKQEDNLISLYDKSILHSQVELFTVVNDLLLIKKNNMFIVINKKKEFILHGNFNPNKSLSNDNSFLMNIGKVERKKTTILINIKTSEVVQFESRPYYPTALVAKKKAVKISSFIEMYNPFTGEIFWTHTLSELLGEKEVSTYGQPILINNNNNIILFLFDSSRKTSKSVTLYLSIETGEVLFKTKDFGGWLTENNGEIYSVFDKKVQKLDPQSFNIINIDLSETLSVLDKKILVKDDSKHYSKTFFLSNNLYVIKDDYFYFTEDKGATIGIINLSTKRLLWHAHLKINSEENPSIKSFKVNNNKIFVLDQGNTLHIFEKENILLS